MYNSSFSNVSYTIPIANPSVHLAVNGNRIKTYNEDGEIRAYLKDGTEFQLEFHNDSDCYVKADININGKSQSSSLVLRPHQRFYLDRFIDENKKFMFNTFLTGNDDIKKLKEIIAKNGRIEVRFYKEFIPIPLTNWTIISNGIYQPNIYTSNTSTGDAKYMKDIINESNSSGETLPLDNIGLNSNTVMPNSVYLSSVQYSGQIKQPKEIETGRIEAGKKSNQDFKPISKSWEFFSCTSFSYHIMPESQRLKVIKVKKQKNVIQADDIRTYCASCGRRIKKGYNFCPGCGNSI